MQYVHVGEMESALHVQMSGYQSDMKNFHLKKAIAKHFNSTRHFLEDPNFQTVKESYWIWTI